MFAEQREYFQKVEILLKIKISGGPAQHGLVPAQTRADDDTVEARQPSVHLLHPVLLVQHRVDHQLRAVGPDDGSSRGLTEDVDTVSPCLESSGPASMISQVRHQTSGIREKEEIPPVVSCPCEEKTATEYCDSATVTFPETQSGT